MAVEVRGFADHQAVVARHAVARDVRGHERLQRWTIRPSLLPQYDVFAGREGRGERRVDAVVGEDLERRADRLAVARCDHAFDSVQHVPDDEEVLAVGGDDRLGLALGGFRDELRLRVAGEAAVEVRRLGIGRGGHGVQATAEHRDRPSNL